MAVHSCKQSLAFLDFCSSGITTFLADCTGTKLHFSQQMAADWILSICLRFPANFARITERLSHSEELMVTGQRLTSAAPSADAEGL